MWTKSQTTHPGETAQSNAVEADDRVEPAERRCTADVADLNGTSRVSPFSRRRIVLAA